MTGILIVTGSSRGIGAAIARMGGERGYDVCVNYHSNADRALEVVGHIEAQGQRAIAVQGDMASEDDIVRLFETVDSKLGRVTALVNNAGITGGPSLIEDITGDRLERTFRTNIFSGFLCAREAIKRMSTKYGGSGGAIVNVSSVSALLGNAFDWVHYASSKGAVDTFTIGLANEALEHGIRCNGVRPGFTRTDINPQERIDRIEPTIPMKRSGEPEEIAEAVHWMLSDKASYCSGATITVSGGR